MTRHSQTANASPPPSCSPASACRRRRRPTPPSSTSPTIRPASSTRPIDEAFAAYWKEKTGETVTIEQSHGGSGAQARAVIDGLDADVVTLALAGDIDAIAEDRQDRRGLADAAARQQSTPYTSTIVFLVRKGNPKGIKDWGDLVKAGRRGHHAQPEDLGRRALELSRRLGLCQRRRSAATRPRTCEFVARPLSATCRCSTPARAARPPPSPSASIGDVLLAWENEAFLALKELGADKFDIVVPPLSILAEPPVAVVDANVDAKGTRKVAEAYLDYLYSDAGAEDHRQELLPAGQARARPIRRT